MNSGALDSLCGGMKGGQGLINVYRGSSYKNPLSSILSPMSSVLIPVFERRLKRYSLGSIVVKHPICFPKECHQGTSTSSFAKKSLTFSSSILQDVKHLKEQLWLRDQYTVVFMVTNLTKQTHYLSQAWLSVLNTFNMSPESRIEFSPVR